MDGGGGGITTAVMPFFGETKTEKEPFFWREMRSIDKVGLSWKATSFSAAVCEISASIILVKGLFFLS